MDISWFMYREGKMPTDIRKRGTRTTGTTGSAGTVAGDRRSIPLTEAYKFGRNLGRGRKDAAEGEKLEKEYTESVEQYAVAGQEKAETALEREMAKLRARLGYAQSAGAGTGGRWESAKLAMGVAGAQQLQQIQSDWQMWQSQMAYQWAMMEDQQKHQIYLQNLAFQQQMQLNKQMAELNDPSWWQQFGSIIGRGLGVWGMAGFPWFGSAPGTSAVTGTGYNMPTGLTWNLR
jgi:hypothetical protein